MSDLAIYDEYNDLAAELAECDERLELVRKDNARLRQREAQLVEALQVVRAELRCPTGWKSVAVRRSEISRIIDKALATQSTSDAE